MKKRLLALNLALVLLLSLLPFSALAVDAKPGEPAQYVSYGNWDHESVMFTPEESGYYAVSMFGPNGYSVKVGRPRYSSSGNMSTYVYACDWDDNPISATSADNYSVCYLNAGETYEFYVVPGSSYSPPYSGYSVNVPGSEWTFRAERLVLPQLKLNETQYIDRADAGGWATFTPDADGFYYFVADEHLKLQSEDGSESWNSYRMPDISRNYADRMTVALRGGETYYLCCDSSSNITISTDIPTSGRLNFYVAWSVKNDGTLVFTPTDYDEYIFSERDNWPWDAFRNEIQKIVFTQTVVFTDITQALWCPNLKSVALSSNSEYGTKDYYVRDGVLFNTYYTTLVRYPENLYPTPEPTDESDELDEPVETSRPVYAEYGYDFDSGEYDAQTDYVIPDDVHRVSGFAFSNLTNLETLEIPADTLVASNAFLGTHSLREIHYRGSERAWNRMNIVFDKGYEPVVTFGEEPPHETVKPIDENADRVGYPANRGGIVQMFWEMNGKPEPESTSTSFADLPEDAPYYKAALWAMEQGITAGTSSTTFSPDSTLTRAQVVTFLWRAMGSPAVSGPCIYQDADSDSYYYDPLRWLQDHTEQFVFSGTDGDEFHPYDSVDSLAVEYLSDGDWSRVLVGRVDCAEHNWEQCEVSEATCTRWGFVTYACTECGAIKRERGNAPLGHEFQAWETVSEPGCAYPGYECSVCVNESGHALYRRLDPLGHDWSDWFVTQPATADKEGLMTRVCRHDSSHVEQMIIPPLHVKISAQPEDAKAAVGEKAVFTVVATGDGLTYKWQYSADNGKTWSTSSSKEPSATCTVSADRDGWLYRCEVRDRFGNVQVSRAAKLYLISDEAPVVLTQPEDQFVPTGSDAVFTVSAKGPGLTYQWYYRQPGKTVWYAATGLGAKTPELTIQAAESRDGQSYRCRVTTAAGKVAYSEAATLAVFTGPYIKTQPQDAADALGAKVSFSVSALGEKLTYKWEYSQDGGKTWLASSSKTNTATCTLSSTNRSGWLYRCTVTDGSGRSVTTRSAKVTVLTKPEITQQPQDAIGKSGDVLKFTIAAKGTDLTYAWQYSKDGGKTWLASSSKTTTASCTLAENRDGWLYRCIVTDGSGNSVTSDTAKVNVLSTLAITSQPQDAAGRSGDVLKFRIAATGKDLTYAWQYSKDGGKTWYASSSKSTVATCTLVSSRDGWLYRCIVSDAGGNSVTSRIAKVKYVERIQLLEAPKPASGRPGEVVKFTVNAAGEGLTYQWQYSKDNGSSWLNSSSKTAVATCTVAENRDGWLYRCVIRDAFGDMITTENVRLKVIAPVQITTQPKAASGAVGEVAKFTIAASGDNLTYVWQYSKDGGKTWLASSSKTTTATCTIAANRDGWLYRCVVTDGNGYSVTSNSARLIVK